MAGKTVARELVARHLMAPKFDARDTADASETTSLKAFLEPNVGTLPPNRIDAMVRSLNKSQAEEARKYNLLKPAVMRALMPKDYDESAFLREFAETCQYQFDEVIEEFVRTRMPAVSAHVTRGMIEAIIEFGHCSALQAILELLPPYYAMLDSKIMDTVMLCLTDSTKLKHGTFTAVCQSKWPDLAEFYFHIFKTLTPAQVLQTEVRSNSRIQGVLNGLRPPITSAAYLTAGSSTGLFISLFYTFGGMFSAHRFVEVLTLLENVLMTPSLSDEFVCDEFVFIRKQRIKIIKSLSIPVKIGKGSLTDLLDENIAFVSDEEEAAFKKLLEMDRNKDVEIKKLRMELENAKTRRKMYFKKYIRKAVETTGAAAAAPGRSAGSGSGSDDDSDDDDEDDDDVDGDGDDDVDGDGDGEESDIGFADRRKVAARGIARTDGREVAARGVPPRSDRRDIVAPEDMRDQDELKRMLEFEGSVQDLMSGDALDSSLGRRYEPYVTTYAQKQAAGELTDRDIEKREAFNGYMQVIKENRGFFNEAVYSASGGVRTDATQQAQAVSEILRFLIAADDLTNDW
jgi:hypothetical protein